jgi:quercetin dioxygenase-like cupin family protein
MFAGDDAGGMEYSVIDTEDVPVTDLSEIDDLPPDLDIRPVSRMLGAENVVVTLWYFDEGEEIRYHAHAEQEELFFVLEGEFSLKLGRSDETERREVDAGAFWVAAPMIGHGHRCVSDDGGRVLAIGAPAGHDPGLDPHELSDDEIDETL